MPIQRHIKNVVHNYTDAERKVREATSNDPWGPSSTLMAEIADKTHNVMAFTEIMQMIWRRLNDKSKNWRHVYKALVLLDYIIKTGSDKVAAQCRENIPTIETLQDFEYFEDGKDLGHNVRAKARLLSSLLRDEERLHEERTKALLARDRLMHGGLGTTSSAGGSPSRYGSSLSRSGFVSAFPEPSYIDKKSPVHSKSPVLHAASDLDSVRPQSVGEEQLQLQLAIAISKEEHDREERRRKAEAAKEEAKVQMALEQSRREEQESIEQRQFGNAPASNGLTNTPACASGSGGGLFSLVDTSLSAAPAHVPDPWSTPLAATTTTATFGATTSTATSASQPSPIPIDDPWSSSATGPANTSTKTVAPQPTSSNAWPSDLLQSNVGVSNLDVLSPVQVSNSNGSPQSPNFGSTTASTNGRSVAGAKDQPVRRRTPADFLGEHQGLVDLEKLIEKNPASTNPFAVGVRSAVSVNPFLANQPAKPSLNELAPTLALTGGPSSDQQSFNPMFSSLVRPPYGATQAPYIPPVQTSPWPSPGMVPQNQTSSLNPFY
ncbi:unnamed protein product [Calicophoron daubneyi]|uniref:ENTH domain-containing protein n=1 Tax=Calicophoron daubneyi TaxID=300641 RepID=A0AAV2TRV9_CALDB